MQLHLRELAEGTGSSTTNNKATAVSLKPFSPRHLVGTSSRQKWLWKQERHVSAYCSSICRGEQGRTGREL